MVSVDARRTRKSKVKSPARETSVVGHPIHFGIYGLGRPPARNGDYGRRVRHFITFSCYEKNTSAGVRALREFFVKILPQVRERYRFRLVEYVLMNACPTSDRGGGSRRSC